jgi:hypothetical protein
MITNGYFLMPDRIERLNKAGLDHMQISIDNVMPDEVSKKSLKVLDKKLQMLAEHADFHVNINSVVGGGTPIPRTRSPSRSARSELGFSSTIGIIHDGSGQLKPLGEARAHRLGRGPPPHPPQLLALQPLSGGHRQRPAQRLALPRRLALPLRRRERHRQLLLAAARLSRHSHRRVHQGHRRARVPHREVLRAQLHHQLRPPGQLHRPLARPADHPITPGGAARAGQHPVELHGNSTAHWRLEAEQRPGTQLDSSNLYLLVENST